MIRNKRVPASHVLTDGAMVRIIRSEEPVRFEQSILAKCKTARARGELAKTFKLRRRSVTVEIGASMLRQEMLRYGIPFDVLKGEKAAGLYREYGIESVEDLHISIGEGRARLKEVMANVVNILLGGFSPLVTPTGAFNNIELTTLDPVSVKLSSCCKPNPTTKGNCALLTIKGLSVHDKRCERFKKLKFQREDAVNVFWRARKTNVRKPQILHVLKASRKEMMRVISFAPREMEMQSLEVLTSYSSVNPAWELKITSPNLYVLQKILRHFDKTRIPYEFDLDC